MNDSKENISKINDVSHDGHRERLTNLINNVGLENVSKIQAVEYFLTYIFPRGDVNPLAHRLLDRFENFGNIVDASENDLKTIKGINDRSAKKIKLFGDLIFYYSSSKMTKKISIDDRMEFLDLLEQMLRFQTTEYLYLMAFNNKYLLTHKRRYNRKENNKVGISPMQLYDFIASTNPAYIVVAHNHSGGSAIPSPDDYDAMNFIDEALKPLNCQLIDSFIVGLDGVFSERQTAFVRKFDSSGKIISLLQ